MFSYICGEIIYCGDGILIIDNHGIGYEMLISNQTFVNCHIGEQIQIFVYMQVREDGIALFGFSTEEEKQMFLKLISISGVGPKVALSILSGINVNDLAVAIINKNTDKLVKIKGLGKKTAERIILELKEKISPMETLLRYGAIDYEEKEVVENDESNEAAAVLMSLGITRNEAIKRTKNALNNGCKTIEEILNYSLKNSK